MKWTVFLASSKEMSCTRLSETDPAKQKVLVDAMHRRLWGVVPYVPLDQLKQPFLWRKNISGVLKANTLVFWNIEKN